jgi:mannose-6-phosphate isomerase-like protein (cupin superfamily)
MEGQLEVTIDGATQIARAGLVVIVPSNVPHSVKALTDGRAIIVDYPLRREFDSVRSTLKRVKFIKSHVSRRHDAATIYRRVAGNA